MANERIKTLELLIAFIRILSPNKAPPVFLLDGSTEIKPIVFSGKSIKKRRTISSTKDDFPAPPVPVIPKTGVLLSLFFSRILSKIGLAISGKFSAEEIILAKARGFLFSNSATSSVITSPTA